ncbi:MAG: tetratricopeptide repeat protein, partial [Verrucomicrobiales bacterium]|nr:tetratricopeptide repeat protein [Verrucomicrobiales bacterium]
GGRGDVPGEIADYTVVVKLEGVPKEQIAMALVGRGAAKGKQGDALGAIADYTAVVELEGAPKEQIATALFNRALQFRKSDQAGKAISDLLRVVESGVTSEELLTDAAEVAFSSLWSRNDREGAEGVLSTFSVAVASLTKELVRETTIRFLSGLASSEMKMAWPIAWRKLAESENRGAMEALEFLRPVCAILEGGDAVVLEALPPEQREFVQSVLSRFEKEAKDEG